LVALVLSTRAPDTSARHGPANRPGWLWPPVQTKWKPPFRHTPPRSKMPQRSGTRFQLNLEAKALRYQQGNYSNQNQDILPPPVQVITQSRISHHHPFRGMMPQDCLNRSQIHLVRFKAQFNQATSAANIPKRSLSSTALRAYSPSTDDVSAAATSLLWETFWYLR
jgi:hypothetical protein